jgi:Helix-turn-helix domain
MLSPDEAEQIFILRASGLSMRAIASELGHSHNTIKDYLHGRSTPGLRAARTCSPTPWPATAARDSPTICTCALGSCSPS